MIMNIWNVKHKPSRWVLIIEFEVSVYFYGHLYCSNIENCMSYELSYNEVIKIEGFAVRQR